MKRRRFLSLAAAFACAPKLAEAATWTGRALGAQVSLSLRGPRAETTSALAKLPAQLDRIEDLFSLYRERSVLSRLNRFGRVDAPPEFHALIDQATRAHQLTEGLFDPTIQPLWEALAKGDDTQQAKRLIGWTRLRRENAAVHLDPGQKVTFNGIAQGFATDLIRDWLAARGFDQALVNMGEHAALGGPFRLGLADPHFGPIGQTSLTQAAIATSSPGAMQLGAQTHILNPKGQPPLWSTISIKAQSATMADALSTAAIFMPAGKLQVLKRHAKLDQITTVDHQGNLRRI